MFNHVEVLNMFFGEDIIGDMYIDMYSRESNQHGVHYGIQLRMSNTTGYN
jgi:hypothetical protein